MHSILVILLLAAAKPKPVVQTDSAVVRQIAEYILNEYQTGYKSGKDGKLYDDPRDIPADEEIRLVTNYAAWNYTTGIMNSALLEYAAYSGESKFADFPPKHVAYALQEWNKVRPSVTPTGDWHPFYGLRRFNELDFVGPECGALMDLCDWFGENEEYEALIQRAAEHIRHGQARLEDGTLVRTWPREMSLWADDLFMGMSFLTRYAVRYGDQEMLRDAIRQVDNFNKYLWDPKAKLFWHAWFSQTQANAGVHWGRCNGWVMRATVDLLSILDPESEDFERILGYFQRHVDGVRDRQRYSGMWTNVLDARSYEEASCTAIFAGCIAHGVVNRWLDPEYAEVAQAAWEALKKKYIVNGQLNSVCIGTGIMDTVAEYAKRPAHDGEVHGAGLVLKAGLEMLALKDFLSGAPMTPWLRPTFASCSVELNASAPIPGLSIEYRPKGKLRWTPVQFLPFYREQPGYRTSITRLEENTLYECRVMVNGAQKGVALFRTWSSDVPISRTVVLDPKSSFPIRINAKGNAGGWVRYTAPEGTVLVNKGSTPTFIIEGASNVILEGIVMKGPNIHQGAINVKKSQDIRIINCEISGWGRVGPMRFDKLGKPCEGDNVINFDGAIKIQQGSSGVVVERCYIHDPAGRTNSWRYSHPAGAEAVVMYKPDHSTVLRYNDFVGGGDIHRFNDSVESFGNFDKDGGFNRDADIYGNFMAFCNDDCIELDGGQRNVRCFDNRFESALVGVSIQGCMVSPSFLYNNVFSGLGDEFGRPGMNVKTGSGAHGAEARSFITENYFGPRGGGIGFMSTLTLDVENNIMDKTTNFGARNSSPQSITKNNVMNLKLDEEDLPDLYPMRPCPFVLSRQRYTDPAEDEFTVNVIPLDALQDSVHFVIRQNYECDWFEVTPASGYIKAGEELNLHVKMLRDKMQTRRYYRGAFLVRTPEGLSRPFTLYKETDFLPPFKAEKPGDVAVYLDAFHPTSGTPDIVENDKTSPTGKAVRMTKKVKETDPDIDLTWEFTVPQDGRYYVLLHGSGRNFPDIQASVDGAPLKKSEHQTNTKFMIWTILAPGGNFNNRIAYYDLRAGVKHTLRIASGTNKNTKILSIDGICITDNPEAFEPR